jgi:hypothetical protein
MTIQAAQTGTFQALLAVIEPNWRDFAFDQIARGKQTVWFGTNAAIGRALNQSPSVVLFKVKGDPSVVAKASLLRITDRRPQETLPSSDHPQNDQAKTYKFYYEFNQLVQLPKAVPLSSLRYRSTGNEVPDTVAGACIVEALHKDFS